VHIDHANNSHTIAHGIVFGCDVESLKDATGLWEILNGFTPNLGAKYRWDRFKSAIFD